MCLNLSLTDLKSMLIICNHFYSYFATLGTLSVLRTGLGALFLFDLVVVCKERWHR